MNWKIGACLPVGRNLENLKREKVMKGLLLHSGLPEFLPTLALRRIRKMYKSKEKLEIDKEKPYRNE